MFRILTPRQLAFDMVVPVVLALLFLVAFVLRGEIGELLVGLGMAMALTFRRLSPGAALLIAWAVALLQMALQLMPNAADIAIAAVLYATAAYGSTRVRWAGFVSAPLGALAAAAYLFVLPRIADLPALPGSASGAVSDILAPALQTWIAGTTFFLLAWTLGLLARTWMRARESRRAQAEAERTVVVEQERNRIARDMHDVVAHSLAVVIAQADGARYAGRTDPAAADVALTTIAATAREALSDVRMLLARLRHSEGDVPQPALEDLDRLADSLASAGLDLVRTESGTRRQLSAAAQLAVYRVVQEALTNALRHGDRDAPVRVHLAWGDSELRLSVRNRLRGASAPIGPPGHGLTGMGERAALTGGRLTAEPVGDQFTVEAVFPVPPHTGTGTPALAAGESR